MQITRLPGARRAKRSALCNAWVAALFLGVSLACTKRIDFGPTGEIHSAEELLKLTDQAERQIASIKGEARLRVTSPKNNGSLNTFVAVSEPDKLHLESLNFFGKPQTILVSAAARFELLDSDGGKYYRGPASQENLSRFMPVAVPVVELVDMMLGRAPRIAAPATLSVDLESKSYIITLNAAFVQQTLWIDPLSHRVTRSQVRGPKAYDVTFEDFQSVQFTEYPLKVALNVPSEATRLELKYRNIEINPRLPQSLFELAPPKGVEVIELDETGQRRAGLP
jgi:hypothetical protein